MRIANKTAGILAIKASNANRLVIVIQSPKADDDVEGKEPKSLHRPIAVGMCISASPAACPAMNECPVTNREIIASPLDVSSNVAF